MRDLALPLTKFLIATVFAAWVVISFTGCDAALAGKQTNLAKPVACVATQFARKGDRWAGEKFFCLNRAVDEKTLGIASRTLPCHSLVLVTNIRTGRSVRARVIDTGPYWAVPVHCDPLVQACWNKGRPKVAKHLAYSTGLKHAGCVDLTPPAARAIRLNGKEPVIVYPLRLGRKR